MMRLSSFPNPALRGLRLAGDVQRPGLWYRFVRRVLHAIMCSIWNVRVFNRRYEPADGGVVYICNHQSFLDPILMSLALRRPVNYMARDSLFRLPGFKQLIESLNAFPVKRGTADLGAIKESIRRLKRNAQTVIFAEGTRTRDGRIGPFLPGVAVLSRRAAKWTVPVVIDGAFEAWPRTQPLPLPGNIVVQYAPAISRDAARKLPPKQFVEHVRRIMIQMQADIRRRAGRKALQYD